MDCSDAWSSIYNHATHVLLLLNKLHFYIIHPDVLKYFCPRNDILTF